MHNGVRYSRRLEARNDSEALAELALFDRDPDAYLTKSQATRKAADEAVLMEAELVARFLAYLKAESRAKRYRRDMRTYLAQWAEALVGRDQRHVTFLLREVEAVITPAQNATLGLKVPPARLTCPQSMATSSPRTRASMRNCRRASTALMVFDSV